MTSFQAVQDYSPFAVALVGLSTTVGLWNLGSALLWALRLHPPLPWSVVTATLLGILSVSLLVQISGMFGFASRLTLNAIWIGLIAIGCANLLVKLRIKLWPPPIPKPDTVALVSLAVLSVALLATLIVSIAPSTKIDELYYHMLVPSRIVSEGALYFYRMPWEAAIWPQMAYQIASAPMHAIGYPDAANVVSWALGAMLVWFAWQTISSNGGSAAWSTFWAASLCVGMYPVVWHVTAGAHAMGDLAMAAAVVAFSERDRLLRAIAPMAYAAMASILLLVAASSKVSLLPACVLLLAISLWNTLRSPLTARLVVLAYLMPWLLLYCPILIWTWRHSGSPFGPMLIEIFGSSVYSLNWVKDTFEATRQTNQPDLFATAYYIALAGSPIVWVGALGAIFGTDLPRATRATLGLLLGFQLTLIYLLLPHDPRYLSGIYYGMLIVFASHPAQSVRRLFTSRIAPTTAAVVLLLLPWLGLELYYAKQFFSVALGLEKEAFYRRHVALYDDFMKLNRLLPKDAVLLVPGYRLDFVYAPRSIFFDPSDVPPDKEVFLLPIGQQGAQPNSPINGYEKGAVIYRNPEAVIAAYRTPGRSPIIGAVQVNQLRRLP